MPIFIETEEDNTTPTPRNFLDSPINPGDRFVGQTHGPAGMGIGAYMDRPEAQPDWTPYDRSMGYTSPAHHLGQTEGPAGMGMNAYVNRPGPMGYDAYGMMDDDMMNEMMMAKIYQSGDPGMINKGSWASFMPGGDPFWDEVSPQGEAINTILNMPGMEGMRQGSVDDWNYKDFREKVPQYLWDQLPEGAFETLSDFRNQQPITVT